MSNKLSLDKRTQQWLTSLSTRAKKSVSSEGQIVYLVRPNNVSSKAKSLGGVWMICFHNS